MADSSEEELSFSTSSGSDGESTPPTSDDEDDRLVPPLRGKYPPQTQPQQQQQHHLSRQRLSSGSQHSLVSYDSNLSSSRSPLRRNSSKFGSMAHIRATHKSQQLQGTASGTNLRERARQKAAQQQQQQHTSSGSSGAASPIPALGGSGSTSPRSPHGSPRAIPIRTLAAMRALASGVRDDSPERGDLQSTTTMRIAPTVTTTARLDPDKPVNGTFKLRKILTEVNNMRTQVKSNQAEDIGDAQFYEMKAARKKLEDAKEKGATLICAIGERISIEAFEVRRQATDLMEATFRETDHRAGNYSLLAALSRIVSLDMPMTAVAQGWVLTAIRDGSHHYLDLLLRMPEVRDTLDDVDLCIAMLQAATKNSMYRGRLYYTIAKNAKSIQGFVIHKKALAKFWQAAFDELSTRPRGSSDDSDVRRVDAMDKMISTPVITVDFMLEDPHDRQTIFSRLARDGEVGLVHKILNELGTGVIDINRVQRDGSTALMQAVVANEYKVVAFFAKQPHIDLFKSHPSHGDAIRIAVKNNRDPRIINILRERAKELRGAGGEEEPDFLLSADELRARAAKKNTSTLVDGTLVLKPMLQGAIPLFEHFQKLLDDNADPVVIRDQGDNLMYTKQNLQQKIQSISHRVLVREPQLTQVIEIAHLLVKGTDRRSGSVDLLQTLFTTIEGVTWAKVAVKLDWLLIVARDTCSQFLEMILSLDGMTDVLPTDHAVELLSLCVHNRTLRIPMTLQLLKKGDVLRFDIRREKFGELLQPFFVEVSSAKRAVPREDRNGRMELLASLVKHSYILLDPEFEEKGDHMTVFTRACEEGDTDLVDLLTESKTGNHVRDINRQLEDGTTPLVQAVRGGNHTATVQLLLKRGAKAFQKTPIGTAVDVAIDLHRDPMLVSILQGQQPLSSLQLPSRGEAPGSSPGKGGGGSYNSARSSASGGMGRSRELAGYYSSDGGGGGSSSMMDHTAGSSTLDITGSSMGTSRAGGGGASISPRRMADLPMGY